MNAPAFLMIADRADGPVSPTFLMLMVIAVVIVILIMVLDRRRSRMQRAEYTHALDTVRLCWLEDYDAQTVQHNDQWAILICGKVVGAGSTLRDAIDNARITR